MKLNKSIKIFITYFLGPLLFLWLSYNIYIEIKAQPNLVEHWQHIKASFFSKKFYWLVFAIVLVFVNIGVEVRKWQLAIKQIQKVSYKTATKAVLSGMSFSISTPNRVGEYFGRVLYLDEGNKIKAIALTIVTSVSQLMITLFMGILGFVILKKEIVNHQLIKESFFLIIEYGSIIVLIILVLLYFNLSGITKYFNKFSIFRKYFWAIQSLEKLHATLLIRFLSLSLVRYIIFTMQYFIVFQFFNVQVGLAEVWLGISVMFLVMTAIPSIAIFTDLGLKNEIIIKILGIYSTNSLGISLTSLTIWLINLVIPALIGTVLLMGIKNLFIKKNYENI
ncbi:MAG: hypothetical protein E6Q89_10065 [Bacteroidia bacterium]|nr:MAG: hypothetical protein E6Q89_10065 [Bacteroidia bacterium]